jgi:HAD superfamily hydrolase (TIGR01490 family)
VESSVEPEHPAGAAFFDLDKTIIARSSTLAFGRSFYRSGLIGRADVLRGVCAEAVFKVAGAGHGRMERIRGQVSALCRGWRAEQVREIVAANLGRLVVPYVYPQARALLAGHRAAGRDLVIVSTSGREIVEPIGELLGVDHVIATQMVIADGRYTGDFELYAYGAEKAAAVRGLAAAKGYRLEHCFGYSDSVTDLPMLEAVGFPHAVNPDRALRAVAADRHWPVIGFALGASPARTSRSAGIGMNATKPIEITNRSHEGLFKRANSS